MMQYPARPASSMAVPPTLLGPCMRETLYEKLPLRGRPLSCAEILRLWTKAVMKKEHAVHSMEEAQEEYEDYASDIIAVVGQDEYNKFLGSLLGAIRQRSARVQDHGDF